MYFTSVIRYSPEHGKDLPYYKIKESFRDVLGRVHTRVVLTPGYLPELCGEEIVQVRRGLTFLMEESSLIPCQQRIINYDPREGYSEKVLGYIDRFWRQILDGGKIDASRESYDKAVRKARRLIDVETVKHTDAREVGPENVCLQAIRELQLDSFLRVEGWNERRINATLASLIVRTVYSPSEWEAIRVLRDNSSAMELLTGSFGDVPTQREVYAAAPSLFALKDKLERHLCHRTDTLFNLTNRVMLFDLTNFYFEGSKQGSKKAKFGRSKEKRSDCRLLVLALAINTEGFIRYSSILAGNTTDPKTLPNMVENIIAKNPVVSNPEEKVLVVIDAGIATKDNLLLLRERGYNYLCVSRTKPDCGALDCDGPTVTVLDSRKRPITLAQVAHEDGGDYFLRVNSPSKAITERSMNRQWRERFEAELTKARDALTRKGGIKDYDKVIERVGRARGKYPSVAKYYQIEYTRSESKPQHMADIRWQIALNKDETVQHFGTYFLRTNVPSLDERTTWDYYNLIREIETSNRQLKTDLELRPIYHQKDENSDAHLFFGMLSYWIVNTIRHKLKQQGINHYWTELKRILFTQKAITTEADNAIGEPVELRLCSDPTDNAAEIYRALGYSPTPFKRYTIKSPSPPPERKICSTHDKLKKNQTTNSQPNQPPSVLKLGYLVQFAQRMAGVGAQARMTIPEILAFAATLDANGQKVEMSASAMSRLIMMLFQKPQEIAKTVGLDVEKFTETLNRSTNEGVLMFLGKLQEIGEADALAALSPLFKDLGMDGIRMAQVLATLATHLDMVKWEQKEANKAFTEATSATREYNIFNNTAQAGIDKARKHIHELAIELGEKLLPLYKHIMTSGSAMLRFLNVLVNFFIQYKGVIVTFTASWIAYKVAVNASNIAFKAHYYWLVITEGAQKLLGTATLALKIAFYALTGQVEKAKAAYTAFHLLTKTTPWGIILAAVTALGVGIYNLCTRTDELTKKTNEAVKAAKGYNAEAVKEQHELDVLFGKLKGAEKGTKEYEDAKRAIINQYGKYLSGLINEKGEILNLEAAYNRLTLAVRRSAQERGIAAAREQIDQEYYKSLASGLTDLQASLESAGATTRDAAEIVAAVSSAMAAGKPIPQNYINKINGYSKGIEWRLLPDWVGGSQHPFWGGDSRKPAPIVNRMYNAYETHRKGLAALDAMEDGVSPLRHIDNYYLKGTIGQLEKIVKNNKAGNAIVFIEGTQQGEYKEVSVAEAKQLLTQYREELAYRGASKTDATGLNLDTTGGTGGAAGGVGGATPKTTKGGGGSQKSEDKFKAEKDWREYQEALNRIAYATGEKNYEEYTNRMLEIEEAFYRKQLAHADLTANEHISIEAQLYEVLRKQTETANKKTIEDENRLYALRKSETQQQYIDGLLSTEAYNEQMQRIELEHLKAIKDIYSDQAFAPITEWEETKRQAAEMMQTQFNGNVDLLNRPVIDAHELTKAGWKGNPQSEGEATATVYSSQYGIKDSTGQVREILVTPILPDGSVLTEKELEQYVYKTLQGAEDILEADDKGLVIAVDVSADGKAGENLHTMQEAYYSSKPNVDEKAWANFLAAEEAYQNKLIAEQQKKQREAEEAEQKHQAELKRIKDEYFGNNAAENKALYDEALSNLDKVYQAEVAAAGDNAKEKLRIDEAYEKAKLALKKKYNQLGGEEDRNAMQKWNQDLLDWLNGDGGQAVTKSVETLTSGMSSIFSQLSSLVQAEMEIETAAVEKRYEREVSMAEGNKYKTKQLEKQKQKEIAKVKDEANRKLFAMQVIQAVAQTATAALNAYSSAAAIPVVGYILAPIAAAMAIAAGAIQIATIKKQQQASTAQGYARGGFTKQGAVDEVAGVVHAGEWVASQKLLASPVARPLIEALDYAQRTNTIGSLRQSDVSRTITAPAVLAQSQAPTVIVQENKTLRETLARLNERLNEPFVTVNTVTGDLGIKQAQDDYQRLMNNKSPKNKRK